MVLEVFLKLKKVETETGRVAPLSKVKIGTNEGNGYLFAGDVSEVSSKTKQLEKETNLAVKELFELERKKVAIEKKIKTANSKVAKAEKRQKQWEDMANREVLTVFESESEDGVVACIIEGGGCGKLWMVDEEKNRG